MGKLCRVKILWVCYIIFCFCKLYWINEILISIIDKNVFMERVCSFVLKYICLYNVYINKWEYFYFMVIFLRIDGYVLDFKKILSNIVLIIVGNKLLKEFLSVK